MVLLVGVILILAAVGVFGYFKLKTPEEGSQEAERQKRVAEELKLTYVEPVETDLIERLKGIPGVTDEEIISYKDGVNKLMDVASIMKLVYQKQIGADPNARVRAKTKDDRELIDRYGHPWCLSDASDLCCALPSLPKRTSTVIPDDVECDDAKKIGSPFEVIKKTADGKLVPVPYAEVWSDELSQAVYYLREAAEKFSQIPREEAFAQHLYDVAAAFESKEPYPFYESDESWNRMLASDSLFFIRVGPDEVGGDGVGDDCECKARYHFNLGIVSGSAGDIIKRIEPAAVRFENEFAELIDDPNNYVPTDIQVQLPVFLDVIYANGDDVGGPSGTPIGQTLPNWCGKDGKGECLRGTMIYVNKTEKAYSDELMKKYIMPLFDKDARKYFNAKAGLDSVVYHEMFHNFGPRDKKTKPASGKTYGEFLVTEEGESWRLPMEELKAQTGSMYMATRYYEDALDKYENNEISKEEMEAAEKQYREHIMYDLAWAMRMILRASRSGPEFKSRSPYSRLAAVQIGFLADQGAIKYNEDTKEWSVDFEAMPDVISTLMKEVGRLYVGSRPNDVEEFFVYYMKGDGEKKLHRDRIVEVAGEMPSVLFDYRIKGL